MDIVPHYSTAAIKGQMFFSNGSRFKVQGSRFKVQGSRFKVQEFKVQGSRSFNLELLNVER